GHGARAAARVARREVAGAVMSTRPLAPETHALATLYGLWLARTPQLDRVLPERPRAGDPLLLMGSGFASGALLAWFDQRPTWAVAVSDRVALTVVPAGPLPSGVAIERHRLRSPRLPLGG